MFSTLVAIIIESFAAAAVAIADDDDDRPGSLSGVVGAVQKSQVRGPIDWQPAVFAGERMWLEHAHPWDQIWSATLLWTRSRSRRSPISQGSLTRRRGTGSNQSSRLAGCK